MSAAIGAFLKTRQVSSPICAEGYWVGKGYLFLGLWIRIIPSSVKAKSVWPFQQNLTEQMWHDDRNRCNLAWRLEKGRINSPKEDKMKKVHVHLFSSSSSSSSVSCLLLYWPGNIRVVWYLQEEQDTTTVVINSVIWWSGLRKSQISQTEKIAKDTKTLFEDQMLSI